jgi:ribosomal protein S12 methylthiotransferase
MQPAKIYLGPVGCPKANVDLEKLSWLLAERGFEITQEVAGASVAVLLGCAFIDDAKRETIDTVLEMVELKQAGSVGHIVVAGCLPEKYGGETARELPEIDALVGNSRLDVLPEVIGQVLEGRLEKRVWAGGSFGLRTGGGARCAPLAAPWTRTLMISDGCDNACTYCAIPHMRGPLRSRPASDIVAEAHRLAAQGAREIVLAGQDTASYGTDRGERGLAALMARLAEELPSLWFRLSYANASNLQTDVADVMRANANVCNYVDMPIQHASPAVLKRMGRSDDIASVKDLIRHLRAAVPDVALRTSVIVGFPGEMESDFEHLLGFLSDVRFDLVGVFTFSPQPGTPAASLAGRVPDEVKDARLVEVVSHQAPIMKGKMEALVGQTLKVLVEDNAVSGRTQYDMAEIDRVVHLAGCRALPGGFITARIDDVISDSDWLGTHIRD